MRTNFLRGAMIAALMLIVPQVAAHEPVAKAAGPAAAVSPAARGAAAAVDAFHAALRRGDTKAALAQLAEDALIFEAGGVERSKTEYASHHLGADAEFSKEVPATLTARRGNRIGELAWIASEGRIAGSYKGKAIDRVTAETMVLRRTASGWKIVHIHWSSAARAD